MDNRTLIDLYRKSLFVLLILIYRTIKTLKQLKHNITKILSKICMRWKLEHCYPMTSIVIVVD